MRHEGADQRLESKTESKQNEELTSNEKMRTSDASHATSSTLAVLHAYPACKQTAACQRYQEAKDAKGKPMPRQNQTMRTRWRTESIYPMQRPSRRMNQLCFHGFQCVRRLADQLYHICHVHPHGRIYPPNSRDRDLPARLGFLHCMQMLPN